ncbi:unnamed protein product [Vitrella brassicaformis CCMP3155]|uniref:Uncharacterized protein n=2 Tax=Vitrella brassicaformis TaxID=1169539 RepID=A0A0G4ERD0_VITBC|nr:unnamed protein product [Vitrella brassicaformis CCMP3155]|eukprot:CEM00584.1 unnamed protein product [Vitrella brassicaformis CCMP3155]
MDGPAERLTAQQAALAVGKKRKPEDEDDHDVDDYDDGDRMSISSSSSGSDWEADRRRKKGGRHAKKMKSNDGRAKGKKASMATKGRSDGAAAETDDVEMQVADELSPADVLSALGGMVEKLQAQIQCIEETKAEAERVFELKMGLPQPDSPAWSFRGVQEVERQFRVLASMVTRDVEVRTQSAKTATHQMAQTSKKLDIMEQKINKLNQHEDEEVASCLEGLAEALWTGDGERLGVSGFLGYTSFMQSLSSVSTYFRALSLKSEGHPILELDKSPTEDIAKKLIRRLSVRRLRMSHCPTPALVRLVDGFAATLETLQLTGEAANHIGQEGGRRYRGFFYGEDRKPIASPRSTEPVAFPRLHKVTVQGAWSNIAQDRDYQLPVLKSLTVDSIHDRVGCLSWIRRASAGLSSLHVKDDYATTLDAVATAITDTPSANTLVCLKGAIFGPNSSSRFLELIDKRLGGQKLCNIDVWLARITTIAAVQALHRFRTSYLEPGATEVYRRIQENGIHLPLDGDPTQLADCLPTAQLCCDIPQEVTLRTHAQPGGGVFDGPLVCPKAKQLTIEYSNQPAPLPAYVVSDPSSLFPSVECVVVKQGEEGSRFYEGGVASVQSVSVEVSARANPEARLCLVPDCVGHLSCQGRPLPVHMTVDLLRPPHHHWHDGHDQLFHSIHWSLYGNSEDGREAMQRRVSRLQIDIKSGDGYRNKHSWLSSDEGRQMYTSFAACVADAFESFSPSLKRIVLVPQPRPAFGLVGHLREASKKRFIVSNMDAEGAIEMRPAKKGGKRDKPAHSLLRE